MKGDLKDYYLGLDIGTSSLGWAVTDPEYNIPDYRRKAMWGIHLFNEGNTAKERRMFRCARRRLVRRKQRITLLRELFSDEISKIDPGFFQRMDESMLIAADRTDKIPNSLFNSPEMTDSEYHDKFPTIYHLRKHLMQTDTKPDIRLVYLAVHHIIKYRGHFLFNNLEVDDSAGLPDFSEVIDLLVQDLSKYDIILNIHNPDKLNEILSDRTLGVTNKKNAFIELLGCNENNEKEIATLLSGGKANLEKLFTDESLKDVKISFKDSNIDEMLEELEDQLEPDHMITIRLAKQIFDWSTLNGILKGHSCFSDSKIESYTEHENDLRLLKAAFKQYAPEKYNAFFKAGGQTDNYCSYVNLCSKGRPKKTCDQITICKTLDKIFKNTGIDDDPEYSDMMLRIRSGTLLPKQRTSENSVIPYSVHRIELKSILSNAGRFHPFLNQKWDDGLTPIEKILKLEEFRIPYYVGPMDTRATNGAWAVRRTMDPVTPWNFEKVIDLEACAKGFMNNLTGFCTYLYGEKVLPNDSIVYSYFKIYNEINTLSINGERLSPELKNRIVEDLFVKENKKVTKKRIRDYLVSNNLVDGKEDVDITGIDDTIKSSLKSYHTLKRILKDKAEDRKLCEDIIFTCTVFSEIPMIKYVLNRDHGDVLTKTEIGKLSKLQFNGWGRLSNKFLTGMYVTNPENGQNVNIMGLLKNTNMNLMEIYNAYTFKSLVEEHNLMMTSDSDLDYEYINRMYLSPAVKRGIWRTVCVVRDVIDRIGHAPSKVFVETTRDSTGKDKGKRKNSRKEQLMQLYKTCKEDVALMESLNGQDESKLRSRSLYLYYTQRGRCMYCGRPIDIDELGNTDVVDRDHIYPQSKVKDDSIHNNMVLTCKTCNSKKTDNFPVDPIIQNKMKPMWKDLLDRGYITSEKFARLTRTTPFTDSELERFINRQLVETSQMVTGSIDVLKKLFGPDVDIVYVKGGLVSEFRQNFDFVKCRSVNDLHHAKDAYLNIVVGNTYDTKFTKNVANFLHSEEKYNIKRIFDYDVKRNGTTAWEAGEDGTIRTVRKYLRRDNIAYTRYNFENKGQLFDDNLVSAKPTLYNRSKELDSAVYGGYDNEKRAFYSLVEFEQKGKKIRSLEVIHIHSRNIIDDIDNMEKELTARTGFKTKVIIPKIKLDSIFEWGGFRLCIGGKTGDSIVFYPAIQCILPDEQYRYCKSLFNFDRDHKDRLNLPVEHYGISKEANSSLMKVLLAKLDSPLYHDLMKNGVNSIMKVLDEFNEASPDIQAEVLNNILFMFQCNPKNADLKKIGGAGTCGRIVLNKKLPPFENVPVYLVNSSPSGMIEQKVRLN